MKTLSGIPISSGYAEGPIFVFRPEALPSPPTVRISAAQAAGELRHLQSALAQTQIDLELIQERLAGTVDAASASHIFHAHIHILSDPTWTEEIERLLREDQLSACAALHRATEDLARRLEGMDNTYLADKAVDLRDVARRVMSHLDPELTLPLAHLSEPSVVVAKAMMPSDMVHLDRRNTLAIVTEEGGVADHVAIVTRSLAIPGITGIRGVADRVTAGQLGIVDGKAGKLLVAVSETARRRYSALRRRDLDERRELDALRDQPAVTRDGHRVALWANVGDADDARAAATAGAEAIGLFRTELAFLTSTRHPSEAKQLSEYRRMAEATEGLPLTIRTLDLGGDKQLRYDTLRAPEANPLLGNRGIRRSLAEPQIFRRQLRALLRLAVDHEVRVLLPMVVSVRDVERAREQIALAADELRRAGRDHRPDVPLGVMVETPAAVMIIDDLVARADFASVGTNDLIQYLLVADRTDSHTRQEYTLFHPAVLRSLAQVAQACSSAGIPICLCGELAGFATMTELLLGLGHSTLSMAPSEIPAVKRTIGSLSMGKALRLAKQTLKMGLRRGIEDRILGSSSGSRSDPK